MANKRFKILKGALQYLRNGDTASDVSLPAGTPLRKFQEWANNEREITYTRRTESKPQLFLEGKVNPFALDADAANLVTVPISKRVELNSTVKAAFTVGGVSVDPAVPGSKKRGFVPAKCTVIVPNASLNKTNEPSQYTGVRYSSKGRETFTFPYGRKTSTAKEADVRADIKTVFASNTTYDFRFVSEKY
jgi:hypothetical protein